MNVLPPLWENVCTEWLMMRLTGGTYPRATGSAFLNFGAATFVFNRVVNLYDVK